ncbi:MAG TPA: hypothetical protein VGC09_11215, partial [Rhodopila sp.]
MTSSLRTTLLHTTTAAALFAAGGATAQTVITGGGSDLGSPAYEAAFKDAVLNPPYIFSYTSSGSSNAQKALIGNFIANFGGGTPFTTGSFTGTPSDLPNVDFAASDAALSAAQISSFTSLYGYP